MKSSIFQSVIIGTAIIGTGLFIVNKGYAYHQEEVVENVYAPIISEQARMDYQNNKISRNTAKKRIDSRLEWLQSDHEITSWQYNAATKKYLITLNDGSEFAYYLN